MDCYFYKLCIVVCISIILCLMVLRVWVVSTTFEGVVLVSVVELLLILFIHNFG